MMPSVTFIIPTYNAERHLGRCLESIRGQDYPREKVGIIIPDGGSSDNTLDVAGGYDCKILRNPKKLAEYGLQQGILNSTGDFLVPFAADNELVGRGWIQKVVSIFASDQDICAVWGRLSSGPDDSSLNKYFELIQSDPLNWFLNRNLNIYKKGCGLCREEYFVFKVDPSRPLVWGANGIVYRAAVIKPIWEQEGYLGDNDAFQHMIEQGHNKVAYFSGSHVFHHHVASLRQWISKWRRNYKLHFLDKLKTRNVQWVIVEGFNCRLCFWMIYSLLPLFSGLHAFYLMLRDRNIHWLYHPWVSFLQTCIYLHITLTTKEGRSLIKNFAFKNRENLCTF